MPVVSDTREGADGTAGSARHLPLADPALGAERRERADATRNRARILDAAERLFAEHGVHQVGVADVARAAGVGDGTIYRRFGDRSALALTVLDGQETQLQQAVLGGPAPLGLDALPDVGLHAFLAAIFDLLESHTDLLVASEAGDDARYNTGPYAFYRLHTTLLLRQHLTDRGVNTDESHDGVDVDYLADALLAPLDAELYRHQRATGMTAQRVKAGLHTLIDSGLDCASLPHSSVPPRRHRRQRRRSAGRQ